MKTLLTSFYLVIIFLFVSCFSTGNESVYKQELEIFYDLHQRYYTTDRSAPRVSNYRHRKGVPEFIYSYNAEDETVSLKCMIPTGLSEGKVIPNINIITSTYKFPISGEVLSSELLTVGDEDDTFNQYFSVIYFLIPSKAMQEIRNSGDLSFVFETSNRESLIIRPSTRQFYKISILGQYYVNY